MSGKQQVGQHLTNAKDGTDLQKPSIIVVALNLMHRFLCLCVRFVVSQVHGEHGPSMAPINDLLLLESATSIAEKIRTKKVSSNEFYFFIYVLKWARLLLIILSHFFALSKSIDKINKNVND